MKPLQARFRTLFGTQRHPLPVRWSLARTVLLVMLLIGLGSRALAGEHLRIGVSVSDLGNPFFVQIALGAEAKARQLAPGKVEVTVVSSAYDVQRQIAQIDSFVAAKVDLILLSAASYEGVAAAVKRAQKAGIKVLAVDVRAQGADATVTTDNAQAGAIACRYLAQQLAGQGNVVIINGPPVSSVKERVQGCKRALDAFPGIRLLSSDHNGGGSREGGLETMTHLLTAFPQIDGVFVINDPSAIGAELAARQAGRADFLIVGVDGAPVAQRRLRDPASLLRATAAQFPNRMAAKAVALGVAMMQGEVPTQSEVLIPAELITHANVASYQGW